MKNAEFDPGNDMDMLGPDNTTWLSRAVQYVNENRLKTIASTISVIGAFFVASLNYGVQLIGFEMWIVSNASWIVVGIRDSDYPLLLMFLVYFGFNLVGVFNRIGIWGEC